MSQAMHVYRNKWNGRTGAMTEEQAAIWPELLERVDADPEQQPEIHREDKPLVPVPVAVEPKAFIPARSIKKD